MSFQVGDKVRQIGTRPYGPDIAGRIGEIQPSDGQEPYPFLVKFEDLPRDAWYFKAKELELVEPVRPALTVEQAGKLQDLAARVSQTSANWGMGASVRVPLSDFRARGGAEAEAWQNFNDYLWELAGGKDPRDPGEGLGGVKSDPAADTKGDPEIGGQQ